MGRWTVKNLRIVVPFDHSSSRIQLLDLEGADTRVGLSTTSRIIVTPFASTVPFTKLCERFRYTCRCIVNFVQRNRLWLWELKWWETIRNSRDRFLRCLEPIASYDHWRTNYHRWQASALSRRRVNTLLRGVFAFKLSTEASLLPEYFPVVRGPTHTHLRTHVHTYTRVRIVRTSLETLWKASTVAPSAADVSIYLRMSQLVDIGKYNRSFTIPLRNTYSPLS